MSTMECLRSSENQQSSADNVANEPSAVTKPTRPSWIANLRHKASSGFRGYDYRLFRGENAIPGEKTSDDMVPISYNPASIFAPRNHHPGLLMSISPKQIGVDTRVLDNVDFQKSSPSSKAASTDNPFFDEPSVNPPAILQLDSPPPQTEDPTSEYPATLDSFNTIDDPDPDSQVARQQYNNQQGTFWENVKRILATSFLHPANLTENEFVSLACTHEQQKPVWLERNRLRLAHRAVNQWVTAHETLVDAGIPPRELRGRLLDAFEWMDRTGQNMFIQSYKLLQSHILMDAASLNLTYADQEKFMSLALPGKYDFIKSHRVDQMNDLWDTKKSPSRKSAKPKVKNMRRTRAKPLRGHRTTPSELGNRTTPSQSSNKEDIGQLHNTSEQECPDVPTSAAPSSGERLVSSKTSATNNDLPPEDFESTGVVDDVPPCCHAISMEALGNLSEVPSEHQGPRIGLGQAFGDTIDDDKVTANPFEIGEYNPAGPRMCREDSGICLQRSHPRRDSVAAAALYPLRTDGNYDVRTLKKSLNTITSNIPATSNKGSVVKNSPFADPGVSEDDAKGFRIEFVERRSSSKESESTPPAPSYEPGSIDEPRNPVSGTRNLRKKISTFFGTLARREKTLAKDLEA